MVGAAHCPRDPTIGPGSWARKLGQESGPGKWARKVSQTTGLPSKDVPVGAARHRAWGRVCCLVGGGSARSRRASRTTPPSRKPRNFDPSPMPATRQDLFARLAELAIATQTIEHEAVFTVAQSSKLERELPGGHTKNLFLKDKKGRLFLVVALGHAHIELKTLHKKLGSDRLSFAGPALLTEVLGAPPGSVA